MIENKLANTALNNPNIIPLVYWVSNLNIKPIPVMINKPAIISSFDIAFLLIMGSKIAVNKVMDDKHTSVTGTVDNLMDAKNNIQCPPTNKPVKNSCKKVLLLTLNAVLFTLKYRNRDTKAIKTRYHTSCTAAIDMSAPNMPVNPHINTVKWSINKFLLISVTFVVDATII